MFRLNGKALSELLTNKLLASAILALVALALVATVSHAFQNSNPFVRLFVGANLGVRNMLSQSFPQKNLHSGIVLVTIDDRTLSDVTGLGRWQNFSREYYAKVIDRLKKDGAIVIGVDVLFSEKSATGSDDVLAKSIRNAGNVVLGFSRSQGLFPISELRAGAASEGFFDPVVNEFNSNVYSVRPVGKVSGQWYENFSFALLREYLDAVYGKKTEVTADRFKYEKVYGFHEGPHQFIPFASDAEGNEFLINYLPKAYGFPKISFSDVYKAEISGKFGEYRGEDVKDKIVLIGATATALHDEFFTPVGMLEGVVIHANAMNTVLNRAYLTETSKGVEIAVLALMTFFFALFLLHVGNRAYQIVVSFVALVLASGTYVLVYLMLQKQFNYPVELFALVVLVALASTAYKYMLEEKGKRLLRSALSQYLAEDLVVSVLNDYDEVKL